MSELIDNFRNLKIDDKKNKYNIKKVCPNCTKEVSLLISINKLIDVFNKKVFLCPPSLKKEYCLKCAPLFMNKIEDNNNNNNNYVM
jgi:hypothetical protein